ncbi:MFS transporter [Sediminicoccus sp. KRV36]|uniref:MFS transporter n=1 Tax=Sediminicoccus sp. KRV36 TaxID=3133721 RepID=UPI0020102487|nr:MFS transporter [Sediminicoccus rosea]UPY35461.1 MFS transporter [Sediminicoccus rosea]
MSKRGVVLLLGTTQTLAWASSYYIPAILAGAMARDLGIESSTVFIAFSCAMLLTAFLGPRVGRAIDQYGGRVVLILSNLVFILGLAMLALAQGPAMLFAAWLVLGLAMAMGLYDAGFATLAGLYGKEARSAITGITLIAGFASTVGWPLSGIMLAEFGWRGACWGWALIHLALAMPLNLLLPRGEARAPLVAAPAAPPTATAVRETRRTAILLAFIFAAGGFSAAALGAHLPALLVAAGATPAAAIAAGALMGPAQVAARVLEFTVLRRAHPLLSAKLAQVAHPVGAAILLLFGAPFAAVFVLLHGAGNGINTIVRGTLPLALFGAAGYGARQGLIVAPARFLGALAPALFGFVVAGFGAQALWFTATLSLAAFVALFTLRVAPESPGVQR